MNKLLKLKTWLSLEEAARHMTAAMDGEEVSVSDLLQLALADGQMSGLGRRHLTLSVEFLRPVKGKRGTLVLAADVEAHKEAIARRGPVTSFIVNDDEVMVMDDRVREIEGTWDLAGWGGEDVFLKNRLNRLLGLPLVEQPTVGPQTWLRSGEQFVQLHAPFPSDTYDPEADATPYPATGLPDSCVPVVRVKELQRFLSDLSGSEDPKSHEADLSTKERRTLLCIIGVLCKEAKIDPAKAAKAAGLLASTAASMGIQLGETTIEGHLKKVPEALEARTK